MKMMLSGVDSPIDCIDVILPKYLVELNFIVFFLNCQIPHANFVNKMNERKWSSFSLAIHFAYDGMIVVKKFKETSTILYHFFLLICVAFV